MLKSLLRAIRLDSVIKAICGEKGGVLPSEEEVRVPDRRFKPDWNPKDIRKDLLEAVWTEIVLCEQTLEGFRAREDSVLLDCTLGLLLREATLGGLTYLHLATAGVAAGGEPIRRRMWEVAIDVGYLLNRDNGHEEEAARALAWSIVEWERLNRGGEAAASALGESDQPTGRETAEEVRDRVLQHLDEAGVPTTAFVRWFGEYLDGLNRGKPVLNWTGRSGRARIRDLEGLETRYPRYGPAFQDLALQYWTALSSSTHSFPDWELVDFEAGFPQRLHLRESTLASPEHHASALQWVMRTLLSTRHVIHEAITGDRPPI